MTSSYVSIRYGVKNSIASKYAIVASKRSD